MTVDKESGWNEYSKLVLKELETLAAGIEDLNTSVHEMRKDIYRLDAKDAKVDSLQMWKDAVDQIHSTSQMKEQREKVNRHEIFTIRSFTVLAVIQFLMIVAALVMKFVK